MLLKLVDSLIRYSFYLFFLLVPLVFYAENSELFEFNKMMFTYGFTVVILSAWLIKLFLLTPLAMAQGKHPSIRDLFKTVKRTPLDLPIILYLFSRLLSTVFSLDPHTSIWGFYSRFHEGLLSTLSYIILYYALVSNLERKDIGRVLFSSFASATIVALWGAAEHFGQSPSCFLIAPYKGGVDCWIQDVKNRVFATLGQPNWMGAYLDIIILAALGFAVGIRKMAHNFLFTVLNSLFFAALLFTKSRSSILGLLAGLAVFTIITTFNLVRNKQWSNSTRLTGSPRPRPLLVLMVLFALLVLLFSLPFSQLENYSLEKWLAPPAKTSETAPAVKKYDSPDVLISESSDIRKAVWTGAIRIWQRYPIFGSGVETFAFAYYQDKPLEHNRLSEWDFLYNKAHNEYLNILATTGTIGLLTYLSFLAGFILWFIKFSIKTSPNSGLVVGLFAAWVSILVTNFFGFSVVIIGLYFFLLPALCFLFTEPDKPAPSLQLPTASLRPQHWFLIGLISLICLIGLTRLVVLWAADRNFGLGRNYNSVQLYPQANQFLTRAMELKPSEPVFRDELSFNQAILAAGLFAESQSSTNSAEASQAATLARFYAQEAIKNSDFTIQKSPKNVLFYKTRTKVFYQLAVLDSAFLSDALAAIARASELAPTDVRINYNLGLLLGKLGHLKEGIAVLENTVQLKPDYSETHYALGLLYEQNGELDKARAEMDYMLSRIGEDDRARQWLRDHESKSVTQ